MTNGVLDIIHRWHTPGCVWAASIASSIIVETHIFIIVSIPASITRNDPFNVLPMTIAPYVILLECAGGDKESGEERALHCGVVLFFDGKP
jgi:hypothetical protein